MIRKALFVPVIAVAVLVGVYEILQWPPLRKSVVDILDYIPFVPGAGSRVRVIGGSIKVKLSGAPKFSTDSQSLLVVTSADGSAFQLLNVSPTQGGSGVTMTYSDLSAGWRIDEFVKDAEGTATNPRQAVTIIGSKSSSTVTFKINQNNDSFEYNLWDNIVRQRWYINGDKRSNCPNHNAECEKVYKFQVTITGATQPGPLYCAVTKAGVEGMCDVNIGNQLK